VLNLQTGERAEIGREHRQRVEQHFALPAVVKQFEEVLSLE
jgi:hypothetical protein